MFRRTVSALLLVLLTSVLAFCQGPSQTPRQALIEMFFSPSKGAFAKHLPAAIVARLTAMGANDLDKSPFAEASKGFEYFESGPVLLRKPGPSPRDTFQLEVLGEDVAGDTSTLRLAIHPPEDPNGPPMKLFSPELRVTMKQEAGVWKLWDIGASLSVPVHDPVFIEKMVGSAVKARSAADESSAVGSLRTLNTAEVAYNAQYNKFACNLSDLGGDGSDEHHAGFVDSMLASGHKSRFNFTLKCTDDGSGYTVTAVPDKPVNRSFCTDTTAIIRSSPDGKGDSCLKDGKPLD